MCDVNKQRRKPFTCPELLTCPGSWLKWGVVALRAWGTKLKVRCVWAPIDCAQTATNPVSESGSKRCEKCQFLWKSPFCIFLEWQTLQSDWHSTGCSFPKWWGANPSDPDAQISRTVSFWEKRCWAVCTMSLIWHRNSCASVTYCSLHVLCHWIVQSLSKTQVEYLSLPQWKKQEEKKELQPKVMKEISFKYWT